MCSVQFEWMLISQQQTCVHACVCDYVMHTCVCVCVSPLLGALHVEGSLDDARPLQAADHEGVWPRTLGLHQLTLWTHTRRSHTRSYTHHSLSVSSRAHLPQRSDWAEPSSDPSAPASPCSPWRIRHSSGWSSAASRSWCTHLCVTHTHTRIRTSRLTPQQTAQESAVPRL